MKQILLELDDETAARLDAVAPARSRRRSEFIRAAIRQALWAVSEHATARAYRERPDVAPAPFDPAVWEVREAATKARRPRRR